MSKGLDIRLDGFDALKGRLEGISKEMADNIDKSMQKSILDINNLQKSYTPVDNNVLRQGNRFYSKGVMNWEVYNDVEYAPYVEFGTGGLVSVPPGLEDVAIQFKGKGIAKVNLPARPFFFRAFFEKQKELINGVKEALLK